MKTYKKIIISLIFAFIVLLGLNRVQAASDFNLQKLDFDAKLNTDGSMDVIETWQIHVNGTTNTLFKTFAKDNSYDRLSNVSVSEVINGVEVPFEQSYTWKNHVDTSKFHALEHSGEFEIAWGINTSSGNHTYVVKYRVNNVVKVHNDCAELYWQFIGAAFGSPANSVTGKITLPHGVELLDNLRVWGHGQLNGEIARQSESEVTFNVTPFITGKYLEIRVAILEPEMFEKVSDGKNALDEIISEETAWANKANEEREYNAKRAERIKYISIGVSVLIGIGFVALIVKAAKKYKEIPYYEPTETFEYFREIPNESETPVEVALLYYYRKSGQMNVMPKALSATLLDLSLKKHIAFEVDETRPKKEQIIIKLIDDPNAEALKESEKQVLDLFRKVPKDKNNPQFNMKEFEKYARNHSSSVAKAIEKIGKQAKEEQTQAGHYDKKMDEHHDNWIAGGVVIIIFLAFISLFTMVIFETGILMLLCAVIPGIVYAVLCMCIGSKYSGLTQSGIDEKAKWEGLKKYMQEYSLINDRKVMELALWEKYLVYATVFGNAQEVLKQLKVVYPELSDPNYTNNMSYLYLVSNSNFGNSFVSSIDSAMTRAYQSSVAASSSSSGGGYGGGFSGGGGGGRWRWPVAAAVKP